MLGSVESWNRAVRISVVGLFAAALVVIAFRMASVVVPVVLAWVVAMCCCRWSTASSDGASRVCSYRLSLRLNACSPPDWRAAEGPKSAKG
jgi:hypothetical protein